MKIEIIYELCYNYYIFGGEQRQFNERVVKLYIKSTANKNKFRRTN